MPVIIEMQIFAVWRSSAFANVKYYFRSASDITPKMFFEMRFIASVRTYWCKNENSRTIWLHIWKPEYLFVFDAVFMYNMCEIAQDTHVLCWWMMSIIDAFSASFGLAGIKTSMAEQASKHHSIGPITLCYLITIHGCAIQCKFSNRRRQYASCVDHNHKLYTKRFDVQL